MVLHIKLLQSHGAFFFAFSAFTFNTLSTFSRLYLHIFLCNRVLLHCGISMFNGLKGLEFEKKEKEKRIKLKTGLSE